MIGTVTFVDCDMTVGPEDTQTLSTQMNDAAGGGSQLHGQVGDGDGGDDVGREIVWADVVGSAIGG